jgi:hypothetical protein
MIKEIYKVIYFGIVIGSLMAIFFGGIAFPLIAFKQGVMNGYVAMLLEISYAIATTDTIMRLEIFKRDDKKDGNNPINT